MDHLIEIEMFQASSVPASLPNHQRGPYITSGITAFILFNIVSTWGTIANRFVINELTTN